MSSQEHSHHIVSVKVLARTFGALLVLTFVTVFSSRINFGHFNHYFLPLVVDLHFINIVLAMGIATVKMGIVAAFFMGLRWDKPFHTVIFMGTFVFLAIFIVYTMADTLYRGRIDPIQGKPLPFNSPVQIDSTENSENGAHPAEESSNSH